MKPQLLTSLLLAASVCFAGKGHEIQLDLYAPVYSQVLSPTRSLNTNSAAVSYERIGAFGPRWSGVVNVQVGQMPAWSQSITSSGVISSTVTYRGFGFQLDARFYPAKSTAKRYGMGYGFFVGPYLSYLFLTQHYYERTSQGNWSGLSLFTKTKGSTYAVGVHAGYKFMIKKHLTITPSLWMSVGDYNGFINGFPNQYNSPTPNLPEYNNRFAQLCVGYRF